VNSPDSASSQAVLSLSLGLYVSWPDPHKPTPSSFYKQQPRDVYNAHRTPDEWLAHAPIGTLPCSANSCRHEASLTVLRNAQQSSTMSHPNIHNGKNSRPMDRSKTFMSQLVTCHRLSRLCVSCTCFSRLMFRTGILAPLKNYKNAAMVLPGRLYTTVSNFCY
jgi:hypothetical protein